MEGISNFGLDKWVFYLYDFRHDVLISQVIDEKYFVLQPDRKENNLYCSLYPKLRLNLNPKRKNSWVSTISSNTYLLYIMQSDIKIESTYPNGITKEFR